MKGCQNMWMVIYMAKSKELIFRVRDILADAGIAVRVRPINNNEIDGYYELLVPETEVQIAHEKLIKHGF
jgi:hypothetical protein